MGHFVTFEGLDGSGKTTQLERLAAGLRQSGATVMTTREPGGTRLGEGIRELVVGGTTAVAAGAELGLMTASRAQSVVEVIQPALARGSWVLCDRFHDATEAYQGGGRGLDRALIRGLHAGLCEGLEPDLTLILDLEPAASLARARHRDRATTAQRFEREDQSFFDRVAAVYREIATREPGRCRLIPASGSSEAVWAAVRSAVEQRFGVRLPAGAHVG